MSPRPSSRSAPLPSRMTRESILEDTLKAMREGRFALMTPVRTSTEGRCVATTRWMPTARAFCARRTMASSTSLGAVIMRSASSSMMITMSGIGSSLSSGSSGCCARPARPPRGPGSPRCTARRCGPGRSSRASGSAPPSCATAHFRAFDAFFGSVMIGRRQVREVLVHLELDHLGVDEDELHLVRARLVEDRRDERVDADALARARRAGDQEVRHRPQVVHDGLAVDVLAERERQQRARALEALGLDDVADRDDLAAAGVGNLDADARAAGQPLDADRLGREREREVLREPHDLVDLDAGGGPELVGRDDGPGVVLGDLALDVELGALRRDLAARLGEHLAVDRIRLLPLLEQRHGRIGVAARPSAAGSAGRPVGLLLAARARLRLRAARVLRAATVVFLIENLPGPGQLAHDRRRVLGGERNLVERDLVLPGLLEVLASRRCGAAAPWSGGRGCRAHPTVSRDDQARESHAQLQEDVAERDLGRERARRAGPASSRASTAPVVPIRAPEDVGERPADDAAGLGLLAVQPAPPEREREQHRQRKEEQADPGGLGGGVGQRARPEPPPAEDEDEAGHGPRRPGRRGRRAPWRATPRSRRSSCSGWPPRLPRSRRRCSGRADRTRAAPAPRAGPRAARRRRSPHRRGGSSRRTLRSIAYHYEGETAKGVRRRASSTCRSRSP